MYVPISACYTCGNRNVPYAMIRYPSLLRGGINERERFALLQIVDYYAPYAVAKKKKKEKQAFISTVPGELDISYEDYKATEGLILDSQRALGLLGIEAPCCCIPVVTPPVWPIYSSQPPPGSMAEFDKGEIQRITTRSKAHNGYVTVNLRDLVPETIADDQLVEEEELMGLDV